jgi:chloramphenicol-sensitive protein RarD
MPESQRGLLMGAGAYFTWGFLPLYWRLFRGVDPVEILAHRIVWSLVFVGLLLARARALGAARKLGIRRLRLLAMAALLVGVNWGLYIWGVSSGHVVETALGYFINPLFMVMLGVVALRESLRRAQWVAIGIAAIAVAVLTIDYGRPPWLALTLAFTFALYGLLKKQAGVDATLGLAIETAVLVLPAASYIARASMNGHGAFGHDLGQSLLLVSTGVVTAIPLLLFAGAANRTPLSILAPLQYLSPTLQFLCGLLVFHEAMPPSRWAGFALVWLALGVSALDGALRHRRSPKTARA